MLYPVIKSARTVEYADFLSADEYPPPNECPRYDSKQSDGDAPVLELLGMWSNPSLPSLSGPLWPGVAEPDRAMSMGQIDI